jgi:hypothetical protein
MATIRSFTARVAPGSRLPLSIGETVNIGSVTLYFKGCVGVGYVMEMGPAGLKPTARTTISPEDAARGMNSLLKQYLIFDPVDQVVENAGQRAANGPPGVDTLIALGYPTAAAVVIARLEAEAAEAKVYPYSHEPRSAMPAELRYPRLNAAHKAAMAGALDDAIALLLEEKAARVPRVEEVQPEPANDAPGGEVVEKDDPSLPLAERIRIALADKDRTSHNRIKEVAEKIKAPGKKNIRAELVAGILTTIANNGELTEQVWALIQQPAE